MSSTVAFIPARGGSKGIKNKNLVNLAGKPLIQHTIEAAQKSNAFDKIVVSSDSADILELSRTLGATALLRPSELAQDNSTTAEAIIHTLENLDSASNGYTAMALLQATSPLRTDTHIKRALALYEENDCNMVISVVKPSHHPMKAFKVNESGFLQAAYQTDYPYKPRQNLPECCFANGAIYVFNIKQFMEEKDFPKDKLLPFPMSKRDSIDIDSAEDLKVVESFLDQRLI